MGVHVLDVLVRPVEAIPEGQGGELVDQIKITAAGSAGGTAVTLAKLGAEVRSAGAIGTDAVGDMLVALLDRGGVDTSMLVRRDDAQTSASVLPIRPDGSRPAFHVVGANATFGPRDIDVPRVIDATHLHLGGPEFMGGGDAGEILAGARARGIVTSADVLAPGEPGLLRWIGPALSYVDYFFPNDDQVRALTGSDDLETGCGQLRNAGVGCVAATCGADGVLLVDDVGARRVAAFETEVVDTTGCGDAFAAGFLRGVSLGHEPDDAAVLGNAAAALVAQGLGSDHGEFDLEAAQAFAKRTPRLSG